MDGALVATASSRAINSAPVGGGLSPAPGFDVVAASFSWAPLLLRLNLTLQRPPAGAKDPSSPYSAPSALDIFAFLPARLHQCLYQFSSVFISGDFDFTVASRHPRQILPHPKKNPPQTWRIAKTFPSSRI